MGNLGDGPFLRLGCELWLRLGFGLRLGREFKLKLRLGHGLRFFGGLNFYGSRWLGLNFPP